MANAKNIIIHVMVYQKINVQIIFLIQIKKNVFGSNQLQNVFHKKDNVRTLLNIQKMVNQI